MCVCVCVCVITGHSVCAQQVHYSHGLESRKHPSHEQPQRRALGVFVPECGVGGRDGGREEGWMEGGREGGEGRDSRARVRVQYECESETEGESVWIIVSR